MTHEDYLQYIAYRCVVGSTAYGLSGPNSDLDVRGFFIPPTSHVLSLKGVPEQLEDKTTDQVYWELHKFITLCLASNPNMLDTLYTDRVLLASEIAVDLREMRDRFLSKKAYATYKGYATAQIKKVNAKVEKGEPVNWKNAMHLIRLMLVGIKVLREGTVMVDVGGDRELLLAIKAGEFSMDTINKLHTDFTRQFDLAYESTKLPDEPDYTAANNILIKARRMVR